MAKTAKKASAGRTSGAKKSAAGGAQRKGATTGRGGSREGGTGFNAALKPSPQLAAIVGDKPLARTEAVSRMWDYIKKHDLQNAANRREIVADDKLRPIFGKAKATMFELSGFLAKHLERP